MANLLNEGIDKNVEEAGAGGVVIPKGRYKCVIVKDEYKKNSKKTGKVLTLYLQIVEGEFKGIQKKEFLNIRNKSSKSQEIAQGQLKRLCNILAVEFPPEDTTVMYGKPFMVDFIVSSFTGDNGDDIKTNKVKNYYKIEEESGDETSWGKQKNEETKKAKECDIEDEDEDEDGEW